MHNNQVQIIKVHDEDTGQYATYVVRTKESRGGLKTFKWKIRRTKMLPLWKFREKYIPDKGLWSNYFRCNKCEWERRTIAYCEYCDIPMTEIGSPGQIIREVNGVRVYKLRSDLIQKVREDQDQLGDVKPTSKVDGMRVFKIADLK